MIYLFTILLLLASSICHAQKSKSVSDEPVKAMYHDFTPGDVAEFSEYLNTVKKINLDEILKTGIVPTHEDAAEFPIYADSKVDPLLPEEVAEAFKAYFAVLWRLASDENLNFTVKQAFNRRFMRMPETYFFRVYGLPEYAKTAATMQKEYPNETAATIQNMCNFDLLADIGRTVPELALYATLHEISFREFFPKYFIVPNFHLSHQFKDEWEKHNDVYRYAWTRAESRSYSIPSFKDKRDRFYLFVMQKYITAVQFHLFIQHNTYNYNPTMIHAAVEKLKGNKGNYSEDFWDGVRINIDTNPPTLWPVIFEVISRRQDPQVLYDLPIDDHLAMCWIQWFIHGLGDNEEVNQKILELFASHAKASGYHALFDQLATGAFTTVGYKFNSRDGTYTLNKNGLFLLDFLVARRSKSSEKILRVLNEHGQQELVLSMIQKHFPDIDSLELYLGN